MQKMMYWRAILLFALCFKACVAAVEQESSKANGYLIEKWEKWFHFNDFTHDGILSMDDPKAFEEYYQARDVLSDEQLKTIRNKMETLREVFYFTNKKELSIEDFVSIMKQRYESNKTSLIEMVYAFSTDWLEAIDLNGDKFLSKDEFIMNFLAETRTNVQKDEQFFYTFQPINERVPNDDIIAYFVRFVTEPDRSKPDFFLNAMNFGV